MNVPHFLQNRPRPFVSHCVERLPPIVDGIPTENFIRDGETIRVTSPDSGNEYTLKMVREVPSCSCRDWQHTHWPCKHMLAFWINFPKEGWETLSRIYKESPYFNLDIDVIEKTDTSKSPGASIRTQTAIPPVSRTSATKARQECLEIMMSMNSGLYGVTAVEAQNSLKTDLAKIDGVIQSHNKHIDGLPIRVALPKRRKRHHSRKECKEKEKNSKSSHVEVDGIYFMDVLNEDESGNIPIVKKENVDSNTG